jgi:hypothetical protein
MNVAINTTAMMIFALNVKFLLLTAMIVGNRCTVIIPYLIIALIVGLLTMVAGRG